MTDSAGPEPDPQSTMAAELALGLLEGEDRAIALRRLLAEPAFAAEVDAWHERLGPLTADIADQSAPAGVWPRIEAALGPVSGVIEMRLARWRALALVSTGIAASLGAFLILDPEKPPVRIVTPVMVAQIAGDDQGPVMLASYNSGTRMFRLAPAAMAVNGRAPQLWLIPQDGRPRSLGVFDPRHETKMEMPMPMTRLLQGEAMIAISLEPMGGSPTGLPTGPVVAKGKMQII